MVSGLRIFADLMDDPESRKLIGSLAADYVTRAARGTADALVAASTTEDPR